MTVRLIPLEQLMAEKSGSVDPSKHPAEVFELYSIPAFDSGFPAAVAGRDIGSAKQIVRENDVLLSRIVPHIRRSWVVGADHGRRLIGSGEWIVFRSKQLYPQYLRHVLIGDPFHAQFMRTVAGVGGSLLRARPSQVAKINVPLPPLPEQRRIADILDKADALRALRRAALAELDTLTQSLFLELFSDPDAANWPRSALQDAYWFQEGPGVRKWQFRLSGVKLLNVGNIEKNGTLNLAKTDRHLAEQEAFGKYKHFLVDAGDLVIASSGISFDEDGLLRTRGAFVRESDLPLCMNTSTIRFKAKSAASDLRFLQAWLDSREFRVQITKLVTGSAQQNFGPTHLAELRITLPPLEVQLEFVRQNVAIESLKSRHRTSLAELDTLFASLQHRAFRGEL